MARVFLPIFLLLLASACTPTDDVDSTASETEPFVLELYSTGDASARRVAVALDQLLDEVLGQVRALPNGQLAVAAPASIQAGVADVIEKLVEAGEPPIRRIRIRQWLVEGNPADRTEVPDDLAPLAPSLEATAASVGPMTYRSLDKVEHVMLEDTGSAIRGKLLETEVNARTTADRILLDLNVGTPMFGGVRAEIGLDPGEHIVMAQIERPLGSDEKSDSIVVFVVQAEFI
ncbi:MAG: hypothetical protein ACNS61_05155 [Candidatus Wenzhouxiangella sp. M2_3B_020]